MRDYRIHSTAEDRMVLGGSAFNIKSESLRLGNFSEQEIRALLAQHTAATGQALIGTRTAGQPWLVNALCYDACFRHPPGRDRARSITAEAIVAAQERLTLRRDSHIDDLAHKLQEERVRRVVECKVLRKDLERTIAEGVEQTRGYMDRCGAEAGHLVVFDRAPDRPWAERIFRRPPPGAGAPVTVWGM